jgi:carboxymethylenebutenolidase
MPVSSEYVRFGDQIGYFARPQHAATALPSVVLIHDLLGLDGYVESLAHRLAAAGYAVLAPDLFAVDGVRPPQFQRDRIDEAMGFLARQPPALAFDVTARDAALDGLPEAERSRIRETIGEVFSFAAPAKLGAFVPPLRTAVRYLVGKRDDTRGQRVACVGEGLSARLACEEPSLSAAVVLYGTTPAPEMVAQIRCPVLAIYGSEDVRVNEGIARFADGMRRVGTYFEWHTYEGARHGFFNDTKPTVYDVDASRHAFARILMFLAGNLADDRAGRRMSEASN